MEEVLSAFFYIFITFGGIFLTLLFIALVIYYAINKSDAHDKKTTFTLDRQKEVK